nr:18.2 kDa class I heat shock protein-like [Ipomoea batatas]
MSLIPSFFGGRRSNVFDPFSLEIWDPFYDFPFSNAAVSAPEVSGEAARLPENVKMDGIKASMENGVLSVTVPKEEAKKTDVKAIDISG